MKALLIPAIVLATAGLSLAEQPVRVWEKSRLTAGQALYRSNCVVCHDVDVQKSQKFGPSFWHLFQREKMPMSSMKPNREYIKMRTRFGGSFMPAFQKTLSPAQIELIVDYLETK
ncbi:MAG TPA: cytochrome c [Bryobacteraceae bacterium]|nr:cytochrome c [Bryobacteraceae bacterium]